MAWVGEWGRALVLGTWPRAVPWAVGAWVVVVVVVVVGYRPLFFALSQLYLSLSQLDLSFISALSRRYLGMEIRLSSPHFALTHGYLTTAISRPSHGYLPAIPSSAIPLWPRTSMS